MTAAHCVEEGKGKAHLGLFENFEIKFGSNNISESQTVEIESVVLHEEYSSFMIFNDIALLKLKQKVGSKVICLQDENFDIDRNFPRGSGITFAAGWGLTEEKKFPELAKEVFLPLVDDRTCENHLRKLDFTIHPGDIIDSQTVCAGFIDGINGDGEKGKTLQNTGLTQNILTSMLSEV